MRNANEMSATPLQLAIFMQSTSASECDVTFERYHIPEIQSVIAILINEVGIQNVSKLLSFK